MHKDENNIIVTLPAARMRQLETVASECGLDPADIARAWIIERLGQWFHTSGAAVTSPTPVESPSLEEVSGPSGSLVAAPTAAKPESLEAAKKRLAEAYITDLEERTLFLQAKRFKQWGNYIAGLILTKRGQRFFTPTDIKRILSQELIPNHYGRSGALENEVLTADVRVDAPHDYPHGYPCLKRDPNHRGLYEFIGFRQAIMERYKEDDLNRKLSRV